MELNVRALIAAESSVTMAEWFGWRAIQTRYRHITEGSLSKTVGIGGNSNSQLEGIEKFLNYFARNSRLFVRSFCDHGQVRSDHTAERLRQSAR